MPIWRVADVGLRISPSGPRFGDALPAAATQVKRTLLDGGAGGPGAHVMDDPTPQHGPRTPWWNRKLGVRTWATLAATGVMAYLLLPPSEGCACGTPHTYRALLKNELRYAVTPLESYFADSARYPESLNALEYSPNRSVRLTLDSVTPGGYRLRATLANQAAPIYQRAGTCVLWAGDSRLAVPTVPEGEPRCWVPRRPSWRFGAYRSPEPTLQ